MQVKGLDDSKYIIAATYLSSLVLLAVIIMTYTAYELINTYAVVTSASFILGSTAIIAIVFIPKVSISHMYTVIYVCTCEPHIKVCGLHLHLDGGTL